MVKIVENIFIENGLNHSGSGKGLAGSINLAFGKGRDWGK
jgi:hypothetical protein